MANKPKKILVATPTFTGGSWVCIENILKLINYEYKIEVIGLGNFREISNIKYNSIPYYSFEKINPKWGRNIFFNFIYQFPLQIANLIKLVTFKPNLLFSNGFTSLIILLPLAKLMRIPIIVYYGSYLSDWFKSPLVKKVVTIGGKYINKVFVNSKGSQQDLEQVLDSSKIQVINHWTDYSPIDSNTRDKIIDKLNFNKNRLNVLFVGRFIREKTIEILFQVIKSFQLKDKISFYFVGDGVLLSELRDIEKNFEFVHYLGFVENRDTLQNIYTAADLLWTFADETYLAQPSIEALALGTPIMVPNIAGVTEKFNKGIPINAYLVPAEIGWIVDPRNSDKIHDILIDILTKKGELSQKRLDCQKYAQNHYSSKNINIGIEIIKNII